MRLAPSGGLPECFDETRNLIKERDMKRMTYKTLMKKVNDGCADIHSWEGRMGDECYANVSFFTGLGRGNRQMVEITKIPIESQHK